MGVLHSEHFILSAPNGFTNLEDPENKNRIDRPEANCTFWGYSIEPPILTANIVIVVQKIFLAILITIQLLDWLILPVMD